MKILVLSPHRDDAAFSVGLSIGSWLAGRHAVRVLNCFTQSEYAPYSDAEALHPNDRRSFVSATRKREDLAWNKLEGGGVQFYDLDLLDAPLRLACAVDEVLTMEIRAGDRAVRRVAGAIEKMVRSTPELAVVAPLAVGGHIDHRVVRAAAMEAAGQGEVRLAFYEDLPYAARGEEADSIEQQAVALGLDLAPVLMEPRLEGEGIREAVERKRRMGNCYDSQVDSEVVEGMARFAERYGGRERLWGNRAWREQAAALGMRSAA